MRKLSSWILLQLVIWFSSTIEELFSPLYILASFIVVNLTIIEWVCYKALYSIPFIYVCWLFCQYHAVLVTIALWYSLKSRTLWYLQLGHFSRFWLFGVFVMPYNFRIICSSSLKNALSISKSCMESVDCFWITMDISTILILTICEHRVSFHLFISMQFLLSMSYSSQSKDILLLMLNLFLGILFVDATLSGLFSSFLILHYQCIEKQQIYVY